MVSRLSTGAGILTGTLALGVSSVADAAPLHADETSRYLIVFGNNLKGASNSTDLSDIEIQNRCEHQIVVVPTPGGTSMDYDTLLYVKNVDEQNPVFVRAPVAAPLRDGKPSDLRDLACVVSNDVGGPVQTLCKSDAKPLDRPNYYLLPTLGAGSSSVPCPAEALTVYGKFYDALEKKHSQSQPAEPVQVAAPKPPRELHPFHLPPLPQFKVQPAFVGRAGLGLGNESFSEYNFGLTGVGDQTPRPSIGVDAAWAPMGTDRGLYLGGTTDFVFGVGGSGWDRSGGMIGWRQGAASVDARFGISGEPADLGETALDGVPYGALAFAIERPLPKLPGDLFLAGQMGMDFIRLPYFDASDMYATLSVGWQGDFVARVPEKKPDVTPSAAVEPVAVPEAVPDLPSGILMQEKPLDWEVKLPAAADKLKDVDKAEYARRSDDLRKYALAQNWPGAAKTFKQLIELRDQKGVSLKYDDYKRGKDATQAQGDTMAYYQCLQWMAQTDPARSAEDLKTFESSWAYVSFQVDSKAQEDRSLRLETAFDPQSRNALAHVSEVYDATGTYEGFIPLQDGTAALGYYFGNLLVQIKPLAEDHNVQVFILK